MWHFFFEIRNFEFQIPNSEFQRRNATLITIAPTGTLSIIAGCSSGIEPLYAISYIRRALEDVKLLQINPLFIEIAKTRGFYNKELIKELQNGAVIEKIKNI